MRFYDWLRRDADDNQRPVHIDHAFNNLGRERIGDRVGEDLVQQPRVLREGPGWTALPPLDDRHLRERIVQAYEALRHALPGDVQVTLDRTSG